MQTLRQPTSRIVAETRSLSASRHSVDAPYESDVEREILLAIDAARASIQRCEQALALIAGAQRSTTSSERLRDGNGPAHAARTGIVPDQLTRREHDVLRLIAAGGSNKSIACELNVSVRTVERHINNLYRKINAQNRADATSYALRKHLVCPCMEANRQALSPIDERP